MTQVTPGMSKYEVVDVLGPPLDFLTTEDFLGNTPHSGSFRDSVSWLYLDVPPGRETQVTLEGGVVTSARDLPYDASDVGRPGHEWARPLMADHLARTESDPVFAGLVRLPGWRRLGSPEVLDFVEITHAAPPGPYQIGRAARRFGELDVLLSFCELTSADQLRTTYLNRGYVPVLSDLVASFGIRPRQYDLAHWIFGRTSDSDTVAHLAYVPAAAGVMIMMPWDLLSAAEQSGRSASS
ncbi:MAG: hypothetical protein QOF10_843 [Kribbellaceae bacterium]|jgi:hypothetical protein|nr:hypothetical protein [Kribbellaceae bacterium]